MAARVRRMRLPGSAAMLLASLLAVGVVSAQTTAPERGAWYVEARGALGPALESVGVTPEASLEAGRRMATGDVAALSVAYRGRSFRLAGPQPGTTGGGVDVAPLWSGEAAYGIGLRRLFPDAYGAQHAELVLSVGAAWYDEGAVGTLVAVHPRLVVPVADALSVPVGMRIATPLGGPEFTGTLFAVSVGLRIGAIRPNLPARDDQASPR